jgi:phosphoglycerol transferase MdoB-like AlkP superfamily enzyme
MNDWVRMKIEVPKIYLSILYANMLASLFTWFLLAGFIVLPVTFASLRSTRAVNGIGKAGKAVFGAVQNISFLWLAGTCFVCGVLGLSWLWWENRKNYIWLTDRVFV